MKMDTIEGVTTEQKQERRRALHLIETEELEAAIKAHNPTLRIVDMRGYVHAQTQEKAGRKPFKDIKTMKDDAAAVEKEGDAIKARYTKIFRV